MVHLSYEQPGFCQCDNLVLRKKKSLTIYHTYIKVIKFKATVKRDNLFPNTFQVFFTLKELTEHSGGDAVVGGGGDFFYPLPVFSHSFPYLFQ